MCVTEGQTASGQSTHRTGNPDSGLDAGMGHWPIGTDWIYNLQEWPELGGSGMGACAEAQPVGRSLRERGSVGCRVWARELQLGEDSQPHPLCFCTDQIPHGSTDVAAE